MRSNPQSRLLRALLAAYPDRVTVRRGADRGVMVGGRAVVLEPSSTVRQAPLFLSIDPRETGDAAARVAIGSAVEEEWLAELFPHLLERRVAHRYDAARGKVVTTRQTLFAGLALREDEAGAKADPVGAAAALFEGLRRAGARAFFESDPATSAFLARAMFLREAMPDLGMPDLGGEGLDDALRRACEGRSSAEQARAAGLRRILEESLDWKLREALDRHAPETLAVPSGSRIRVQYPAGQTPFIEVRLQELFGLAETPRLAGGRVPVTIRLLAPNHRPVQVTTDLRSFWNGAYVEIRKELARKYPKHPWPEDPWNAPAVAVGRRRRS